MVQFMIHTFFYATPTCIDTKHFLQLPGISSVIQCIKHPTHEKFGGFFYTVMKLLETT